MYIHLGNKHIIYTDCVLGIFDLDTTTLSKATKIYLEQMEKSGNVISISQELPKSFILFQNKGVSKIYLCQLSSSTLQKRLENGTKVLHVC